MRKVAFLTQIWLLVFVVAGQARIRNVPSEHVTIQDAIDNCDPGDTVLVAPGIYAGDRNRDIDFKGKAITVRSVNPNDVDVVAATVVDCRASTSDRHRGFNFHSGETPLSILAGFTIVNGHGLEGHSGVTDGTSAGGAISCADGSDPTIVNCVLKNNSAEVGGGIYFWDSAPLIRDCVCIANAASDGGALYGRPAGRLRIVNCAFEGNSATRYGGALYFVHGDLTLDSCTFYDNTAGGRGGGVYMLLGKLGAQDSTFEANVARETGGALYYEHTDLSVARCAFVANAARGQAGRGGAAGNYASNTTLQNCVFAGNAATVVGGGVWDQNGSSPSSAWPPLPTLLRSVNCTFLDNRAGDGSALASSSREVGLSARVAMENCIVWNDADGVWNDDGSTVEATYCNIQGGWPGVGNIDVDPLFASPGCWDPNDTPDDPNDDFWVDGDYHLKSRAGRWDPISKDWGADEVSSQCIDAGDPNNPVGAEPFPNGGRVNMGAYGGTAEASKSYFGEPVCETIIAGDINGDCRVDFRDLAILTCHWLEDRGSR